MLQETKKEEQSEYVKEGIKAHTRLMFDGNHNYLHKTPVSENTFVDGYIEGLLRGIDIAKGIIGKPIPEPGDIKNLSQQGAEC